MEKKKELSSPLMSKKAFYKKKICKRRRVDKLEVMLSWRSSRK
jgi:hypothetical protein